MNALTTSKTPGIILSEIKMMKSAIQGSYFLVEGADDSRFWKRWLANDKVAVIICDGKPNLLGVSAQIIASGISAVVGVYDSDFDRLLGQIHHPSLLVPTDENDLELTLLVSEAFAVLLHEYGDEDKVHTFELDEGVTVADYVESTSRHFGRLRYLNHILNHGVNFVKHLSPYRFLTPDWKLKLSDLHDEYATFWSVPYFSFIKSARQKCAIFTL